MALIFRQSQSRCIEFSGFTREKNTFEDVTDYTGGQEEFDKLIEERENKPIVEFTIVE